MEQMDTQLQQSSAPVLISDFPEKNMRRRDDSSE